MGLFGCKAHLFPLKEEERANAMDVLADRRAEGGRGGGLLNVPLMGIRPPATYFTGEEFGAKFSCAKDIQTIRTAGGGSFCGHQLF